MSHLHLDAEDYFVAQQAERKRRELESRFADRLVRINDGGKWHDRRGVIRNVMLDANHGRWLFLVYILRTDEDGLLNSTPDTRQYRPAWDFTLEEGRWRPSSRQGKNASLHDIWFGGEA